jgi:hypothetical protein
MSANWQPSPLERPDPYLDWEYRTRPVKNDDTWCSVQIQVLPVLCDYLPSLYLLQKAVQDGNIPSDHVKPGFFTIRMNDDERVHLDEWIDYLKGNGKVSEDIEMQFFIYRREPFIYHKGIFADPPFYKSIFAGPPIVGLKFNDVNRTPRGIRIAHAFADTITAAVGIVDDGIAFANGRFRSGPQGSRIAGIWLQKTERRDEQDNSVVFGRRLQQHEIEKYLKNSKSEDEIYRKAGATDFSSDTRIPTYNPLASRASHGTHVLDLASGFDMGSGTDRAILAVQLPSMATIDTSGVTMGSYVLQAVRTIMLWANQIKRTTGHELESKAHVPLVINFSYGLLAGPKDGTQQLEKSLTDLIDYRDRRIKSTRLVLPAGNSYRAKAVARLELNGSTWHQLDWVILPDDGTPNFLEIWLDGGSAKHKPSPVEISLTPPGTAAYLTQLYEGAVYVFESGGHAVAGMYYDVYPDTKRARILLAIGPTVRNDEGRSLAPSGSWKISIRNVKRRAVTAHVYVQRDDTPFGYPRRGRQSRLDHSKAYQRDPTTGDYRLQGEDCPIIYRDTLSSLATSSQEKPDHTIVVGAAEATDNHPPADYTSSGPTRLRTGPDFSAFADDGEAHWGRLGAGTFSGSVMAMRGTSVAAPQIARHVANDLAAGRPSGSQTGEPGEIFIDVTDDQARLGDYIFSPARDRMIPRRRYPAVRDLEEEPDGDCSGG